jgi:hypothetical protein
MLAERCLDWSSVDPDNAYLYVVGAVVPPARRRWRSPALEKYRIGRLLVALFEFAQYMFDRISGRLEGRRKRIAGRVLHDWMSFGHELLKHVTVKGICGYPSRTAGREQLEGLGFHPTGALIDGDPNQPVLIVSAGELSEFRRRLKAHLTDRRTGQSRLGKTPKWSDQDRRRFLAQLPQPVGAPGCGAVANA